jgi:hypothetical protein
LGVFSVFVWFFVHQIGPCSKGSIWFWAQIVDIHPNCVFKTGCKSLKLVTRHKHAGHRSEVSDHHPTMLAIPKPQDWQCWYDWVRSWRHDLSWWSSS